MSLVESRDAGNLLFILCGMKLTKYSVQSPPRNTHIQTVFRLLCIRTRVSTQCIYSVCLNLAQLTVVNMVASPVLLCFMVHIFWFIWTKWMITEWSLSEKGWWVRSFGMPPGWRGVSCGRLWSKHRTGWGDCLSTGLGTPRVPTEELEELAMRVSHFSDCCPEIPIRGRRWMDATCIMLYIGKYLNLPLKTQIQQRSIRNVIFSSYSCNQTISMFYLSIKVWALHAGKCPVIVYLKPVVPVAF